MTVEKITDKIKFDLSVQFMNRSDETKTKQLYYSIATALIYIVDIFCFCLAFYKFTGVPMHEHADVIMLFLTLTFLVIDAYYFTWVLSLKDKLPPEIAAFAGDAILGYSKKMSTELWHNLDQGAREKLEAARNKF